MWNFLCKLLNILILHRVNLKKKSGYSINILDVQLIGEFHSDVLGSFHQVLASKLLQVSVES